MAVKFRARIRLIVEVPFTSDIPDPVRPELEQGADGRFRVKDRDKYEKAAAAHAKARQKDRQVDKTIGPGLVELLKKNGCSDASFEVENVEEA